MEVGGFVLNILSGLIEKRRTKNMIYKTINVLNYFYTFESKSKTMRKFHPFFAIGTFGTILIALLHMAFAWGLSITNVHSTFFVLYIVFIAFLFLGVGLTLKQQQSTN